MAKRKKPYRGYVCKDVKLKALLLSSFIIIILIVTFGSLLYPSQRRMMMYQATHRDSIEIIFDAMPDNVFESISLKLGDDCADSTYVEEYLNNKEFYDTMPYDSIKIRK